MMNEEFFYDTKSVPVSERESFNNTILLLTMVKSKYYYIIGFSRPQRIIRVGFDFDLHLSKTITEELVIDFDSCEDSIVLLCEITGICFNPKEIASTILPFGRNISIDKGKLVYRVLIKKDVVFPVTVNNMNQYLIRAKKEIGSFLETHYNSLTMTKK